MKEKNSGFYKTINNMIDRLGGQIVKTVILDHRGRGSKNEIITI